MQTTSLPIQVSPSAPAQAPRTNAPVPNDGANFGAALTQKIELRQVEQRQLEQRQALVQPQPNTAPPQAAAGPKPQAAARPAANEAKAPAREAHKEPAKETAQAAGTADAAETTAAATGDTTDEAPAPDATATDAVVDMLAMVASFNQMQQAAATIAPVAAESMAAQPGALFDALKGKAGDGAEPAVRLDGDTALAAVLDQPKDKAGPSIDLRALDLAKAGEAAKLPLETGNFAATLRDTMAQAVVKEPAPSLEALTGLTAQASALQTAQASGAAPDRLSARVGTPAWDNQVGQKVIWMVGGEDQSATLELNPPDLGPVQVVLNVSNDMASVTFSSQQLEVRQALENALPRLREMMSESGIALGNATVNAGAEGRQGQDGNGSGRPGGGKGGKGTGGDSAVAEVVPRQRTGILGGAGAVDTFA